MKVAMLFAFYLTVIFSASGLVFSKHMHKRYFIELQSLEEQGLRLQTEWEQLLLEESAWSNQARIEQIAQAELKMHLVSHADVVTLELNK